MVFKASRIRRHSVPLGKAARATRAVSSGTGPMGVACSDMVRLLLSGEHPSPTGKGVPVFSYLTSQCLWSLAPERFANGIKFGMTHVYPWRGEAAPPYFSGA